MLARIIALVALCAQALAQGQGLGEDDSPELTDAEWKQLDALYAHFGRLSHEEYRYWFTSSDPCEWRGIECNEQGKMELDIRIRHPNELQASTAVTHALENVDKLTLQFHDNDYPELDLAYIARLLPNLESLWIFCDKKVKSFANLGELTQMPLKDVDVYGIGMPFPLAEWLPRVEHLKRLQLFNVVLDGERPELDLRGLIPPTLEEFRILLPLDHPEVPRVLLSDDLITARERADGSVVHPLRMSYLPFSIFRSFEMECSTLDPSSRPIESERERPDGKHALTLVHDQDEDPPAIAGRPINKFAVLRRAFWSI